MSRFKRQIIMYINIMTSQPDPAYLSNNILPFMTNKRHIYMDKPQVLPEHAVACLGQLRWLRSHPLVPSPPTANGWTPCICFGTAHDPWHTTPTCRAAPVRKKCPVKIQGHYIITRWVYFCVTIIASGSNIMLFKIKIS